MTSRVKVDLELAHATGIPPETLINVWLVETLQASLTTEELSPGTQVDHAEYSYQGTGQIAASLPCFVLLGG